MFLLKRIDFAWIIINWILTCFIWRLLWKDNNVICILGKPSFPDKMNTSINKRHDLYRSIIDDVLRELNNCRSSSSSLETVLSIYVGTMPYAFCISEYMPFMELVYLVSESCSNSWEWILLGTLMKSNYRIHQYILEYTNFYIMMKQG